MKLLCHKRTHQTVRYVWTGGMAEFLRFGSAFWYLQLSNCRRSLPVAGCMLLVTGCQSASCKLPVVSNILHWQRGIVFRGTLLRQLSIRAVRAGIPGKSFFGQRRTNAAAVKCLINVTRSAVLQVASR